MALPRGFIDLAAAYSIATGSLVDIIGVVVDMMPPVLTRRNEHMMSFRLLDPHLRDSVSGETGLLVRFFKTHQGDLPPIKQLGDIVLLRRIKMTEFNSQRIALCSYSTGVLVFPAATIPAPAFAISVMGNSRLPCLGIPAEVDNLSLYEQDYIIALNAQSSNFMLAPRPTAAAAYTPLQRPPVFDPESSRPAKKARSTSSVFGSKFQLIKDLQHRKFADICGEVVKRFPNSYGSYELYVTDYTANDAMWYYTPPEEEQQMQQDGDEYGYSGIRKKSWPGPYGWLVLKVNVKEPHASYIDRDVSEGDLVLLKNVKMKIMSEGSKLEGDMWPDSLSRERVLITKLWKRNGVPDIDELLERKEEYWSARRSKEQAEAPQEAPKPAKLTKKQRRRERQAAADVRLMKEAASLGGGGVGAKAVVLRGESEDGAKDINKHVRCSNQATPLSTLRNILDAENVRHTNVTPAGTYVLPFINANYRTRVRVVDYRPRLAHFAVPALPDADPAGSAREFSPIDNIYEQPTPSRFLARWEWYFELQLEDAGSATGAHLSDPEASRIWVSVQHQEAQYLLGNSMPNPQNLRTHGQLLGQLREKLCILWGNLAEGEIIGKKKKAQEPSELSNRAFECCIGEYGQKLDEEDTAEMGGEGKTGGYMRLYRMFGATIL